MFGDGRTALKQTEKDLHAPVGRCSWHDPLQIFAACETVGCQYHIRVLLLRKRQNEDRCCAACRAGMALTASVLLNEEAFADFLSDRSPTAEASTCAGSRDKDAAMQELVHQAEERAAAAQRRLDEKQAARLLLLAATAGDEPADGALAVAGSSPVTSKKPCANLSCLDHRIQH